METMNGRSVQRYLGQRKLIKVDIEARLGMCWRGAKRKFQTGTR